MKYIKLFEDFNNLSFEFEIPTNEFVNKVLNAMHIDYSSIKLIAEGGYGFTIDLGNNTIFKITTDSIEAYYAYKTLDVNSPNLIKNFDVAEIQSPYQYCKLYAIHQEKVLTDFNDSIKNMIWYLNKMNPITSKLLNDTLTDIDVLEFFKTKFPSWSDAMILQCFGMIKKMYTEAQKYGLPTDEIHSKNVGFRNGINELVYFDISSPTEIRDVHLPIVIVK